MKGKVGGEKVRQKHEKETEKQRKDRMTKKRQNDIKTE